MAPPWCLTVVLALAVAGAADSHRRLLNATARWLEESAADAPLAAARPAPGEAADASATRRYIDTYADDLATFVSPSRWAVVKLTEAAQLCDARVLPRRCVAAIAACVLLDEETRLRSALPWSAAGAVDALLRAVFVLEKRPGVAASAAARAVLRRREPGGFAHRDEGSLMKAGGEAAMKLRLAALVTLPTWHERAEHMRARRADELAQRPRIEARIAALLAEKQMETRRLTRACDYWQRSLGQLAFARWKTLKQLEDTENHLLKFFAKNTSLRKRHVWWAWLAQVRLGPRPRSRLVAPRRVSRSPRPAARANSSLSPSPPRTLASSSHDED